MALEGPPETPEKKEEEVISFEQVSAELKELKSAGVEDPEFTEDPSAKKFQEDLARLDTSAEAMSGQEATDYWFRRDTLFIEAGYTDKQYIDDALEFLEQDLGNAQDGGDQERIARIEKLIERVKLLLPPEQEPIIPTAERIGEQLRQPGRIPMEVQESLIAWKAARLAETDGGVQANIDIEMQAARLYADNGRILDAIGSITAALFNNKKIKKAKPELRKELEDYREELKRK